MANRKEDEKNERIIRSLLKLPDNRRCVNCNSLGPQYVCVNFWTFICTNCSGIHREFTHRVKSVSMAKFTSQEVSALQGGGNASAKEIYLKAWDPQRQSPPDGSIVERLRDFIKHVYVERRYTGERSIEKPPKAKMTESEDFNGDRSSSGGRSPGYDLENRQQSDNKKSPAHTEVVNDWRREDRFGNVRKSEDNQIADGGSRPLDSRSPDRQTSLGASSPPVVRPIREILGENIAPLRILEPPKANGFRSPDSSVRTQRTESSSSLASSNGHPAELVTETSLIDFDAFPEPPLVASQPQPQPPPPPPPPVAGGLNTVQTAQSVGGNWANFDSVADVKISSSAANVNPLESVLAELSGPFTNASNLTAFSNMLPGSTTIASPFGSVAPPPAAHPVSRQLYPGGNSFEQQPQFQQHSLFPAFGGHSVYQSYPVETSNNQMAVPPSNQQWFHSASTMQAPQSGVRPNVGSTSGVNTQINTVASERKVLPEDLFAVNYSPFPAPVRGWHAGPQHGMGFSGQYNIPMSAPNFPQASKSINPFDVSNDSAPAATFPSMSSLQGALPTMTAPGGQHHTPHLTQFHPNAYLGQQLFNNVPSRAQGQGQFGHDNAYAFGGYGANPQFGGLQQPNTLPSTGGHINNNNNNPFG